MKIFTIAERTHECYGHGDYGNELRICRQGNYGQGNFPPVFRERQLAQKYLDDIKFNSQKEVVELELQ